MKRIKKFKRKSKKINRSKIFQELCFDSNDQNFEESNITPDFELNTTGKTSVKSENLQLTPSKSEFDIIDLDTTENDNVLSILDSYSGAEQMSPHQHDSVLDAFTDSETSFTFRKKNKRKMGYDNDYIDEISTESSYQPVASYYDINNMKIVVLKENDLIYCHGICKLLVLHGTIEIFGSIIDKSCGEVNVYSFRGSSLLYIKNLTTNAENFNPKSVQEFQFPEILVVNRNSAVVLVKKLVESKISFVEKHISQQILPKCDENLPRIIFEPHGDQNLLTINPQWNSLLDIIKENTKMLICGGKGVGKSTFLRYAINRLLQKYEKVRIIDVDPGQSEFTVPGCVSILTVDKPVLGANYSHLQLADRSLLSNINIGNEPEKFIRTVSNLLKDYKSSYPTLINYMGFTHGLGIQILSAVIYSVKPTDILQITSDNLKKNFKYKLVPDVVKKHANFFIPNCSESLIYNLHDILSMTDKMNGWTAEPRQMREMCILSYFGQMILDGTNSIYSTKLPLYEINLEDIQLLEANGNIVPPAVVNATLVALCSMDSETQLFTCYGWGIVRGVDDKILVLITPENFEILEKVKCLVSNGFTLPPSVYMTPDESLGTIPYANTGDLMYFGQIPKRSHLSARK